MFKENLQKKCHLMNKVIRNLELFLNFEISLCWIEAQAKRILDFLVYASIR